MEAQAGAHYSRHMQVHTTADTTADRGRCTLQQAEAGAHYRPPRHRQAQTTDSHTRARRRTQTHADARTHASVQTESRKSEHADSRK